jgi:hypothetical protein
MIFTLITLISKYKIKFHEVFFGELKVENMKSSLVTKNMIE